MVWLPSNFTLKGVTGAVPGFLRNLKKFTGKQVRPSLPESLRFQSSKNIKVEAQSEYYNVTTKYKDCIPRTCRKVSKVFEKLRKITRRASAIK